MPGLLLQDVRPELHRCLDRSAQVQAAVNVSPNLYSMVYSMAQAHKTAGCSYSEYPLALTLVRDIGVMNYI